MASTNLELYAINSFLTLNAFCLLPMERQPLLIDGNEARAILCMLKTNVHDHSVFRVKMEELRALVESLGIEVVGELIQSRYRPFAKYHFGSGKVKELRRKKNRLDANLIIFYNILRSSQKLNLMMVLNTEVIDRYELTLEIFDQMASDTLSKLQIQAARLEKQAPFLKLQASINYRHDRPFFRAGGEYAFHGQLRELSRNQSRINDEIEKLMEEKSQRIWKRKNELGYPIVCIAGFYNAGKTSLANRICKDFTGEEMGSVSKVPHETRNVQFKEKVEIEFKGKKMTFKMIDTPGISTKIDYEDFLKVGMSDRKAKKRAKEATKGVIESIKWLDDMDIVIIVLDSTKDPYSQVNITIIGNLAARDIPVVIAANKVDLKKSSVKKIEAAFPQYTVLGISAKYNKNIDEFYQTLIK